MLRRLFLTPLFVLLALAVITNHAKADVFIDYGVDDGGVLVIELQAETANQVVQLFGTGIAADGGADGFELDVQVGDGGSVLGGSDIAPVISSIDLISGTIWESLGPNQQDTEVNDLLRQSTVDTASLASVDGLIGTLIFDTTGFGTGEIAFRLSGVAGSFNSTLFQGSTALTTIAPNGLIRVNAIPEPASGVILMAGLVGFGFRRRRS